MRTFAKPILIHVDDDETNRYAVKKILERSNYQVLSAGTGYEGLELINASRPDLIILDIQLPDIDGRELCRKIKEDPKLSKIPILQMSANFTRPEDTVAGLESGADGYLIQPIDAPVLIATIKSLLRMRKAEQEAERSNSAKSQFLANMSHEIRTPLGAIIGFTELMKDEINSPQQATYLAIIERNSAQLLNLIEDILDLSKVESGRVEMESIPVQVQDFFNSLKDVWDLAAAKNTSKVNLYFESIPETVTTDPTRLRQIVINVVGNAIKFTRNGEINVRLSYDDQNHLVIQVKDSGIGISEEQATRLFQPFSQADQSTSRMYGGTGLGLVLSRHLARAMGGDLVLADSVPGEGSLFIIKVSAETVEGAAPLLHKKEISKLGTYGIEGVRTLLAEDSLDNQQLLNILLNKEGINPDIVSNGRQALQLANEKEYDVILMDIQMPSMDGYEATSELRKAGIKIPIIALTAHAMSEERARCMKVGFTDYISKPVDKNRLYRTIKSHGLKNLDN